jgi:hypothetical protein
MSRSGGWYLPGGVPIVAVRSIASCLSSLFGVLVDVGGLDALVAEPERDRGHVHAFGLEEHRAGVPVTWNST